MKDQNGNTKLRIELRTDEYIRSLTFGSANNFKSDNCRRSFIVCFFLNALLRSRSGVERAQRVERNGGTSEVRLRKKKQ